MLNAILHNIYKFNEYIIVAKSPEENSFFFTITNVITLLFVTPLTE